MNKTLEQIKKRVWLGSIAILCALTGCTHKKSKTRKLCKSINTQIQLDTVTPVQPNTAKNQLTNKPEKFKEEHTITVWIHGTRFENNFIRNKILKKYAYRVFIKNGLAHHSAYENNSNFNIIAENLAKQKNKRFKLDNFYIFGWPGTLSHKARKLAAKELHSSLLALNKLYKDKHHTIPNIRLVTHSHGGNVALCFGKINDRSEEKIKISELILLACPVQVKTSTLIKSPSFEKVYSLFSGADMIQVIDPQGLHNIRKIIKKKIKKPFFSKRLFPTQDNLSQVKLKINGRSMLHIEFILSKFAKLLPHILQEIDAWKKEKTNIFNQKNEIALLKVYTKDDNNIRCTRKLVKK